MAVWVHEKPTAGSQGANRKCRAEPTPHGREGGWTSEGAIETSDVLAVVFHEYFPPFLLKTIIFDDHSEFGIVRITTMKPISSTV